MFYQVFQYRLPMEGQPEDLNRWLAGHRIVSVTREVVQSKEGGPVYAIFCNAQLAAMVEGRFREVRLWSRWARFLASDQIFPARGLPIEALSRQCLGNFMLDIFDRRLKITGQTLPGPEAPFGDWRKGSGGAPTQEGGAGE